MKDCFHDCFDRKDGNWCVDRVDEKLTEEREGAAILGRNGTQ